MIENLEALYDDALRNGFGAIQEKCKAEPAFIFACDTEGDTLLHYAVFDENLEAVMCFVEIGACPFVYNNHTMTALSSAACKSNVLVFQFLIERFTHGMTNNAKIYLLVAAASAGKHENLKYLLEHGYDDCVRANEDDFLNWAAQSGDLECVKLLCEYGVNVDEMRDDEGTALYSAAGYGALDIAQYLLSKGASVDKATNDGCTPLMIASCWNQPEMIKLLLENGANVEAVDDTGATALLYAIDHKNVECVKVLLEMGANIHAVNKKNKGVLDYSKRIRGKRKREEMICVLEKSLESLS